MLPKLFDRDALHLAVHGYYFSCAIYAVVNLGIADALAAGPRTAAELAEELGIDPDATERVLRLLVSVDLFERDAEGRVSLTPVGACLRSDHEQSMAKEIRMFSGGEVYQTWGDLVESVRTGQCAFERRRGKPLFEWLPEQPATAHLFHQGWHEITTRVARETAEAYDFTGVSTITDVGGGYGIFLATMLAKIPGLQGVLFDLPISVRGAPDNFRNLGVADRVSIVEGSAEESVPPMELCTMKSVLHMCTDEQCVRILSRCAAALPRGGKLLVLERVIPDHDGYHWSKLVDVNMLVMTGGRERTRAEYARLYESSGLELTRCVPLASGFDIIEGIRI